MKIMYPALFHEENNSYWVEFPDLEGCNSFGDTKEEAFENAVEALEGYTLTLLEEEQHLPAPSDLRSIKADKSSFSSYVSADLTPYLKNSKAVKKTLTIPSWLNTAAEKDGINFSAVLQDALMQKLNIIG
jgi:predicted RNase H-like HicB family nuclease